MSEPWRTLKSLVEEALRRAPPTESDAEWDLPFAPRYDRVFASLTREELYGDSTTLLDDTLLEGLFDRDQRLQSDHFLDYYTGEGGRLALERYGFLQLLRDRGFEPQLEGDLSRTDEHRLQIYDGEPANENLLIDLRVGFKDLELPDGMECRMLFINWLMMQDPRGTFAEDQSPLPDQVHPGLGLFPHFGYLLRLMALRLGCDGLLDYPAHFHNAVLYGRFFHFVDPEVEGRFRSLERDLAPLPLTEATEVVGSGRVVDADDTPIEWVPSAQVAPIENRARAWFASDTYRARVDQARKASRFRVR